MPLTLNGKIMNKIVWIAIGKLPIFNVLHLSGLALEGHNIITPGSRVISLG